MVYDIFNFDNNINFVISFGILVIIFYLKIDLIVSLFFIVKISQGGTHIFWHIDFWNYLGMAYHQFINRNSGELSKMIINETKLFNSNYFIFLLIIKVKYLLWSSFIVQWFI